MLEAILVLDKSGSMNSIWESTVDAVVNVVKELQGLGEEVKFTLTLFDTNYCIVYNGKPIKELTEEQLRKLPQPSGWTALYDSLGRTIDEVGTRLANTPQDQRPDNVRVIILTDGQENSSTEYSLERVKGMVQHQTERYNWKFMYVGAGLGDAQTAQASRDINILSSVDVSHDSKGMSNYSQAGICFYSGGRN